MTDGFLIHAALADLARSSPKHRLCLAPASAKIAFAIPLELVIRVKEMSREVGGIKNLEMRVEVVAKMAIHATKTNPDCPLGTRNHFASMFKDGSSTTA